MAIIGVDIDGVLVSTLDEVIRLYNGAPSLFSTPSREVKVEDCTHYLWPYSVPGLAMWFDRVDYSQLEPRPGAVEALNWMRQHGHLVYLVSACTPNTMEGKLEWARTTGLINSAEEFIALHHKHLFYGDYLIDDWEENVVSYPHGQGILYTQRYNKDLRLPVPRVNSLREFIETYLEN